MPPSPTRTLNPLHFEDLEPKRFEDLARQLAYDFRTWRQLEATGRTGSDSGFDARGFEIVQGPVPVRQVEDEVEEIDETSTDRLWLIQCKRERQIRPAQMAAHLNSIPPESIEGLYGILFVAACDFSLATRDVLRRWCAKNGISECHIWGKAELEDLLFQPKNDSILFAYFGISLQIRQRKVSDLVRRTTTIKRKLTKLLSDKPRQLNGIPFIIRDISDERYPYIEPDGTPLERSDRLWRFMYAQGLGISGLRLLIRNSYGYVDQPTFGWDIASKKNLVNEYSHDNPWSQEPVYSSIRPRDHSHEFWMSLPKDNQANVLFYKELPYAEILEIDDVGDYVSKLPTIYVNFRNGEVPLSGGTHVIIDPVNRYARDLVPLVDNYVRVFPEEARDLEWEADWGRKNGFELSRERITVPMEVPAWIDELNRQRAEQEDDGSGAND